MASSLISNPVSNPDRSRDKRKKKKKETQQKELQQQQLQQQQNSYAKWKSQTQQQLYSSKLLQALNQVSLRSPNPPTTTTTSDVNTVHSNRNDSVPRGGRAVREAADRVLAVAAKGRTRWSRAILTNRLKLKFRKHKKQKMASPTTGSNRAKKPRFSVLRLKGKCQPVVQRKVRLLGRLVPGCRKEPLPVILEEATDYIAALEMQVRAMSALAELLSGSSSGGGSTAPPIELDT